MSWERRGELSIARSSCGKRRSLELAKLLPGKLAFFIFLAAIILYKII